MRRKKKSVSIPKSRNQSQIKIEDILQPLNGSSRLVSEDLDEVWSGLVTGRLQCIFIKLLNAVLNFVIDLGSGQGTVDARGGLGRVTTEETYRCRRQFCQKIL